MVSYKVVLNRPIRAAARGIMTTFTIANLPRLSAKNLSKVILEESEASDRSFAVVDVRDDGRPDLGNFTLPAFFFRAG